MRSRGVYIMVSISETKRETIDSDKIGELWQGEEKYK
jgi:hypothetical protein